MVGVVNVSFSLPEWQAVKMTFFAPQSSSLSTIPGELEFETIGFLGKEKNQRTDRKTSQSKGENQQQTLST